MPLTPELKIHLLNAPDNELDQSLKPLIAMWDNPPRAIQILEVVDWCIFSSLSSGFVLTYLQHLLEEATTRENTSQEELDKEAIWRKRFL